VRIAGHLVPAPHVEVLVPELLDGRTLPLPTAAEAERDLARVRAAGGDR
jgi:hypothetical protein